MFLAVRISSYGCTSKVWRNLKKLELLSAIAAIIVKWHKTAPGSPIFSRKFAVATLVLIIFVVYVANLGKMMNVEGQDEYIADEGNAEKFRFVAQLSITRLHKTFTPKSLQY